MIKNKDLPAMPTPKGVLDELAHQCVTESLGLTKREMFAMNAPSPPNWYVEAYCGRDVDMILELERDWRYMYADMMLEGDR